MFRTLARTFLPNPLDWRLKRCARKKGKKILIGWNRGLGDLALGLYAIIQRTREIIPDADITFLTRENLRDGFTLLENVQTIIASNWKRGQRPQIKETLIQLGFDPKSFDLIIENPSPTDWVRWQRGKVIPRLKWNPAHDQLWKKYSLPEGSTYIGVQVVAETNYGLWRNWPLERWEELFQRLRVFQKIKIVLFGFGDTPHFSGANVIDLRGQTSLFELLSLIQHRCDHLILPDSGILSMAYYLDINFPIQVISLWADSNQGILKQAVASPNGQLVHVPLIGQLHNLSSISVDQVLECLLPVKPLYKCTSFEETPAGSLEKTGCILMAGGQGSRLGAMGPKGVFPVLGKSLFEWVCEKAPKNDFPIAVMTSPLNHEETISFFEKHNHFDREIFFFQQNLLPFLDDDREILKVEGKEILAPDGNGGVYQAFARSPLKEEFLKRGIEWMTIVPVENVLTDPADRHLIGHAKTSQSDVVVKCVKREKPEESMGVLVERGGNIEIIEYLHLDPTVSYPYSYIGMMAMAFPFFLRMAEVDLPFHWVKKRPPGLKKEAWKREKFLFQALPYAERCSALVYPRMGCYSPVKSSESIPAVERTLTSLFG